MKSANFQQAREFTFLPCQWNVIRWKNDRTFLNILEFTLLIWLGTLIAGFLGSLTGLGGGVVIVPPLTLAFGVDIRYAVYSKFPQQPATS